LAAGGYHGPPSAEPMPMPAHPLRFDFAPFRLSGVVVGALLNHRPQLVALGDAVHQPPHKAAPVAPVLAIKPRNTLAGDGDAIVVPDGVAALEIGASLGIVIGRTACRVPPASALAFVAGYTIVNDVGMPVPNHYRPSVRFKARDGFCPIGPRVERLAAPDALGVRVFVDGALVHQTTTGERVRGAARLLAEVSEFMTLSPGDVLVLGVSAGAPRVRAGQQARVEIDGLGTLSLGFVADEVLA